MFLDPDHVTDLEFVLLVVRVIFLRTPNRLLEQGMGEAALDPHHQCFALFVAYDHALKGTLRHCNPLTSSARRSACSWRRSSAGRCRDAPRVRAKCSPTDRWRVENAD